MNTLSSLLSSASDTATDAATTVGTATEGATFTDRLIGLSSEGGFLYDAFDFVRPLGEMLDGALNLLAAVMHLG